MTENDEGSKPPPKDSMELEDYSEPEDWDLPTVITEDDEYPDYFDNIEHEEALETIIGNISSLTIISLLLGIVIAIANYILYRYLPHNTRNSIILMIIGFVAGLLIVFGAAEIIILGVKGIQDKLNWAPYLSGILQAIGAALAELVVITFLLVRAKQVEATDIVHANSLAITAITLILTTVIINIFFLGIGIIFVSKDEPFDLPKELTFFEANLILGMMVFSFVMMIYGFYFQLTNPETVVEGLPTFNRGFTIIIGLALILVYFIFLFLLIQRWGKRTSTPQTLISEFFPDKDQLVVEEPSSTKLIQSRLIVESKSKTKQKQLEQIEQDTEPREVKPHRKGRKRNNNDNKSKHEKDTALATLRRFPWYIIIILFIIGAGGIVWGGQILSRSIEDGIEIFRTVPILVYSVVVGSISSSPELVVTLRGIFSREQEAREVGLVHQVSAINQTFFILFGIPFVLSGILNIGIPIALEITVVMGGIFIMSAAAILMVMDDNKFDLLEGVVITILAVVSLLALMLIGGIPTEAETASTALQLVNIAKVL